MQVTVGIRCLIKCQIYRFVTCIHLSQIFPVVVQLLLLVITARRIYAKTTFAIMISLSVSVSGVGVSGTLVKYLTRN